MPGWEIAVSSSSTEASKLLNGHLWSVVGITLVGKTSWRLIVIAVAVIKKNQICILCIIITGKVQTTACDRGIDLQTMTVDDSTVKVCWRRTTGLVVASRQAGCGQMVMFPCSRPCHASTTNPSRLYTVFTGRFISTTYKPHSGHHANFFCVDGRRKPTQSMANLYKTIRKHFIAGR